MRYAAHAAMDTPASAANDADADQGESVTVTVSALPYAGDLGTEQTWLIPGTDEDGEIELHAKFLGFGSSYQPEHRQDAHPNGDPIPKQKQKCQACRWYEIRVFREVGGERRFLAHHTGASVVPGEQMRYRYRITTSAHAVVEDLTVRRNEEGSGPEAFIAPPAARALADAAGYDPDLEDAWVNRAVP